MTCVYVDPTALLLAADRPAEGHIAPGTAGALENLVEAGFDVVVLGSTGSPEGLPAGVRRASGMPDHLDQDAWYLTGEPHPEFGRPRGGTTVLVGPRRPAGRVPMPRFDAEARDMPAAAMLMLARQAMA